MEFTNFLDVWFVFLTNADQANEMSSRPSNSVIAALYRDTNCCVEANDAITGVFHCQWDSPEDSSISGTTACMF